MPIAVNPVFPVVTTTPVTPAAVLQPGTVIDARVLKQFDANLVRIALANLTIDVLSEVPLQAGQTLQLAVSQTAEGVRLQIVPQGGDTASSAAGGAAQTDQSEAAATARVMATDAPARAAASGRVLTDLEALAVSAAVQTAATKQNGLAPLYANLGVAAASPALPETLQQAAAQLLAQRPVLDESLTGDDLKTAFRSSGLFLEQSLASPQPASGAPDLKAALLVFRQTLSSWLGTAPAAERTSPQTPLPQTVAPPLMPEAEAGDILLPHATAPSQSAAGGESKVQIYAPGEALPTAANRAAQAGAGLLDLQAILQSFPKGVRDAVDDILSARGRAGQAHALMPGADDDAVARSNVPPPPFRGSDPSAQPVALPSLAADDAPSAVAHRLLDDADGALARQTLLQAASLPDRADLPGLRADATTPRWNFEIPFATLQGTSVAQFEISRDGSGAEIEAAQRVWRARFSLDVEPSGPVHALVTLSGERTSVRMWAERPATAAQLRLNAPQLTHALREAALEPGDIVIGEGAPPGSAPPPAGHFLDRAL